MMVTNLDYDDFKGRIALGRVNQGTISKNQQVTIGTPDEPTRNGKINELFVYKTSRNHPSRKLAGDILYQCRFTGRHDWRNHLRGWRGTITETLG